jgi:WD40 repeat protein
MWSISEGTRIDRVDFESPARVASSQDGQLLVFQNLGSSTGARRWVADEASWRALGEVQREYSADEGSLGIPRVFVGGRWAATFSGTAAWLHDLDHLDHPPRRLAGHVVDVTAVAVSVDGTLVASSDRQSTILIHSLDASSNSPPRSLKGPVRINWLAFDLQGNRLAAASLGSGIAWMWNLKGPPDAAPVVFHRKNTSQVMRVQFDPAGRWLATSGMPMTVQLWPLPDRRQYVLAEDLGIIWDLDFLPDGNHLATVLDDGSLRLWPLSPEASPHHRILFQSPTTHLSDLAVDPLGRFLAVSGLDGTFLVPLNGDRAQELEGFTLGAFCVACSPDGRIVAAAGGHADPTQQVLRVWDLVSGEVRVLTSDDERSSGGFIRILFSPDGRRLFTSGWSGVRTWSLEDGSSEYLGEGLTAHLSDDGEFLYAAVSDLQTFGRASVYDLQSGSAQLLTPHDRATFISSSPDGATLVSGGLDGVIRVGPETGEQPHLLYGHKGWVNPVVSPDGRWIASGGEDGSLRLWPMPDLSQPPLHTLPHDELIAKLKTLTNLRVVRDEETLTGWKVEVGPFPGWAEVPDW